jgi:hypothetical protein
MDQIAPQISLRKQQRTKSKFDVACDQFQIKLIQAHYSGSVLAVGTLLVMHFNREKFGNGEGLVAWPGIEKLAELSKLPERTVQRAIRRLQKDGMVRIIEGGGRGNPHRYIAFNGPPTLRIVA